MKVLKILSGIVTLLLAIVLTWGVLYLCVEPVKNWTDEKIFNSVKEVVENVDDKEEIQDSIATPARINFTDNKIIIGG